MHNIDLRFFHHRDRKRGYNVSVEAYSPTGRLFLASIPEKWFEKGTYHVRKGHMPKIAQILKTLNRDHISEAGITVAYPNGSWHHYSPRHNLITSVRQLCENNA